MSKRNTLVRQWVVIKRYANFLYVSGSYVITNWSILRLRIDETTPRY
jgi:hypothetical protein